jgi:hypothetical protein
VRPFLLGFGHGLASMAMAAAWVVILATGLIAALFVAELVWRPGKKPNMAPGFGPGWECTYHPQSAPTRIKKVRP